MERGVVVGGLMICGSFLLAATLNRSAVKETPPAQPIAPMVQPPVVPLDESCADVANGGAEPVAGDEPAPLDLPGNGREACSQ